MRYTQSIAALLIISLPLIYLLTGAEEETTADSLSIEPGQESTADNRKQNLIPPLIKAPSPSLVAAKQVEESDQSDNMENMDRGNPIDRIRAIQVKTALHQSVLQDHERYRRYPSSNVAIPEDSKDPIAMRYEVDERTTENQDRSAFLTIWTDKKFYQRGDEVLLSAKLVDIHGVPINTRFSAQLIYEENKGLMVLDLQNKGNSGIHQASFVADQAQGKPMQAGNYKLLVINSADEVADAAAFTLSDPVAEFTGQYRDSISNEGNLVIEAEINVTEKEKLYFQASLYTELETAIGVTQNTFTFKPGKHWVPLEFYGLMLHDSGEDGPYLLKNISLARVTMPMQRGPLLHPNYYTQSYERNQFSNQSYESL